MITVKRLVSAFLILIIFGVLVFMIGVSRGSYQYSYDESLYSNEQILNEYNVYEDDNIKFLYPNDWKVKNYDFWNFCAVNNDGLNIDEISYRISEYNENDFILDYYRIPEKLIQIYEHFEVISFNVFGKTKEKFSNDFVYKINCDNGTGFVRGADIDIADYVYEKDISYTLKDDNNNIMKLSIVVENNEKNDEVVEIISESILIK